MPTILIIVALFIDQRQVYNLYSNYIIVYIVTISYHYHLVGGVLWSQLSSLSGFFSSVTSDSTGQYLAVNQYRNCGNNAGCILTSSNGLLKLILLLTHNVPFVTTDF